MGSWVLIELLGQSTAYILPAGNKDEIPLSFSYLFLQLGV